jgi:hypothetical protein
MTGDGWLLLGRRNHKVACHPGYVHNIGGSLEVTDRRADGSVDAFASMARELREEVRLAQHEISELICLGMIRDPFVRQPELIFDARVSTGRAELERRLHTRDEEHTALVACPDRPDAIAPFIASTPKLAPVAVGALCLHGRRCCGEDWFDRTVRALPPPLGPHV